MRLRLFATYVVALALCARGASAAVIMETEPNDTFATAQNIDGHFTLDFSADIGDKTTNTSEMIPHVTVQGAGDNSFDFYSFTVESANSLGIFDIDYAYDGTPNSDMAIHLFNSAGAWLASNHTANATWGQAGSTTAFDPYLEYNFASPGLYVIAVAQEFSTPLPNGRVGGSGVKPDTSYTLQVSVPEPSTLALAAFGGTAIVLLRRRRSAK